MRYSPWIPGITSPVPLGGPVSPSEALMLAIEYPVTTLSKNRSEAPRAYHYLRRETFSKRLYRTKMIFNQTAACGISLILFSFPFVLAYSGLN